MELRQLRYFAAVAEVGTYAAAAASLSVAQPALWRQVRDLERELGVPLFERTGRRVRLTADGQLVLEQALAALAAIDRLDSTAADLRTARTGIVAIACASPHIQRFLAAVIADFHEAHPGVAIGIREYGGGSSPGRGIREDLLDGLVDLATGPAPIDDPALEGFPVYPTRLVVIVPDDHPWRDAATIDIGLLEGQPLVLSKPGAYSRRALEAACQRAGFEPTVAFDSASPTSTVALGGRGLGLSVLADDAIPQAPDHPWPIVVERGQPIGDTVRLAWRAGAPLSAAVTAFVHLARRRADQRQVETSA